MDRSLGRPLSRVRVVDLTRLLPGPHATMLLADLGAEVIKVEHPRGGDEARLYQPLAGSLSAIFAGLNRNKRSLALDLKHPGGAHVFAALLRTADVLVESFRPGVMDRLGFGPERLARVHPRLIVCSLSGYGAGGPAADEAGHDLNFMARAGLLDATSAGARPVLPGFQLADLSGSLFAVSGILAALLRREWEGEGTHLDIALSDSALTFLGPTLAALGGGLAYPGPGQGALDGGMPCYQVYETADHRHLALAALEPRFWQSFCHAVGFTTSQPHGLLTGEEGRAVQRQLEQLFRTRTAAEWQEQLAGSESCCVPVRRPDEVLDDPQFLARDVFFPLEQPGGGTLRHLATPLTPRDRSDFRPPPLLGEHSVEILRSLGWEDQAIQDLQSQGAVGG